MPSFQKQHQGPFTCNKCGWSFLFEVGRRRYCRPCNRSPRTSKHANVLTPGDLEAIRNEPALWLRLASKVEVARSGCLLWRGSLGKGYGIYNYNRRSFSAHRVTYQLVHGPLDPKIELDHLCRTPACVNHRHLEPVTHRENMLRGHTVGAVNARKRTCKRGHEFDGTRTTRNGNTFRTCSECHRQWNRERWRKKKEAERTAVLADRQS